MPRSKTTKAKTASTLPTPEELIRALAAVFSGAPASLFDERDSATYDDDAEEEEEEAPRRRRSSKAESKPSPAKELAALAEKFKKAFSPKELKELLMDVAGKGTVAAIKDADVIDECIDELKAELEDAGGDDGGEEEEISVEAVKLAVQAYQKANGKEETGDILEGYGINTVRSLGKLEQVQLEDLYAEVIEG